MANYAGFSSLSPTLLARKGAARPAMRSQVVALEQFSEFTVTNDAGDEDEGLEDLGWNDMGDEIDTHAHSGESAEIVRIGGAQPHTADAGVPELLRTRESIASRLSPVVPSGSRKPRERVSGKEGAQIDARRAAFTLRLDAERHLKLRLAATILGDSAQSIVTEALDRHLATLPEITELASKVRKRN